MKRGDAVRADGRDAVDPEVVGEGAIERLGAKRDGILRSHQLYANGSLRDTVVYSIVAAEWPAVKQHLEFKLG